MNAEIKTVLLVDDEPANIEIVNSILKDSTRSALRRMAPRHWNSPIRSPRPI